MPDHRGTSLLRRFAGILLRLLLAAVGLVVLAVALLLVPAVQTSLAHRVLASLAEKTHTRMTVRSLEFAVPGRLVFRDLFIEGQSRDTLLSIGTLEARVALLPLLSRRIHVQSLWIDSMTARIRRTLPDSSFNFQFLADSLGGNPSAAAAPADTPSGVSWTFALEELGLHAVHGSYNDAVTGLEAGFDLGLLRAAFTAFDPKERRFHFSEIALEQLRADVAAGARRRAVPDTAPPGALPDLSVGRITLAQVNVRYADAASGGEYAITVPEARLEAKAVDLPSHRLSLSSFSLLHAGLAVARRTGGAAQAPAEPAVAAAPWEVSLDRLQLSADTVHYDVTNAPRKAGLDPNHLSVAGLELQAEAITVGAQRAAATVRHGAFRLREGFALQELSGVVAYDSLQMRLSDLLLATTASRIHATLHLAYPSLAALADDPGAVTLSAAVPRSTVGLDDLRFLAPALPLNRNSRGTLQLSARLSGRVRDLRVETLRLAAGDSTLLDLSGSLQGLPAWRTMSADLVLHAFSTGRADVQALLPPSLLPGTLALPASLHLAGTFKGSRRYFSAACDLVSSFGRAHATAAMIAAGPAEPTRWTTDLVVQDFDLGALLKNPATFGPVTLEASANGTGLSADSVQAQMIVDVDRAVFRGYPYENISLRGTAGSRMFQGKIQIDDSNLACTFEGSVNTAQEPPAYKFTFALDGADLYRLHLAGQDLRVAGTLTSNLTGRTINDVNGSIDLRNAVIVKGGRRYPIDSLVCAVVNRTGETHISIASPLLSARFDGTMTLGSLPDALEDHFERYFSLHAERDERGEPTPGPQAFTFNVVLRDPRTLTQLFLPELRRVNTGALQGSFNSATRTLNVTVAVPTATYNDIRLDSLTFTLGSTAERLQALLRVRSLSDSSFQISNLQLAGIAQHDSLGVLVQTTGAGGETKMLLAGSVHTTPDAFRIQLNPDGVVWQNRRWSVTPDGYLLLGKGHLLAHNFAMEGVGESLSLDSKDDGTLKPPLTISFRRLQLGTLVQAVERDTGVVRGLLDGTLELRHLEANPTITSDLTIRDLVLDRQPVGDIALRVNNQGGEVYAVDLQLTGNGNEVAARGTYRAAAGGKAVNLNLDFRKLNLASLEPFTSGAVQRLSGVMTGTVVVAGTTADPSIRGTLNFTNAAFTPAFLGSYLHLNAGEIALEGKTITFRSFNLTDTLGNPGSIAGSLSTEDFRTFMVDLRMHTENFLLLNRPASTTSAFFGTVNLDSDISVKGTQTAPAITVQAVLNKGTDLVVVRQESETNVQRGAGIVTFVDRRHPPNRILTRSDTGSVGPSDSLRRAKARLTLASNIEVGKDTRFRLLVDPVAGDSLVVEGEGTFSFSIDASGKLTLTGRYEISGGSYDFSFGRLIKRRFDIQQGSSITWFGSPLDANVDITAIYTVRASALDLVQDQLAALSQEERNRYRQPLPFQVYLMMGGRLTAPDIHFKLDLPVDQRGALGGTIYAQLTELNSQESELNKQVFALLILGGFISSNPLAGSGDGGGLTGFARTSVSQILTDQLNRLSAQYLTGVNLNVGVQSYQDYSTGTATGRTQLQLALSTKLFNERVTVQAGGNVELEGPRTEQNSLNTFAGDLKVSYNLTEDGRWQLEVFRQNNYEGLIEGELTETGAGIVFTIDYDKLFGITLKPVK